MAHPLCLGSRYLQAPFSICRLAFPSPSSFSRLPPSRSPCLCCSLRRKKIDLIDRALPVRTTPHRYFFASSLSFTYFQHIFYHFPYLSILFFLSRIFLLKEFSLCMLALVIVSLQVSLRALHVLRGLGSTDIINSLLSLSLSLFLSLPLLTPHHHYFIDCKGTFTTTFDSGSSSRRRGQTRHIPFIPAEADVAYTRFLA